MRFLSGIVCFHLASHLPFLMHTHLLQVLLLDEPTSALDPAAMVAIESTVKRLVQSRGLAAVWVSHSGEQVLRVADQVALLVHGEVRDTFSPANLHDGNHKLAVEFLAGLLDANRPLAVQ